MWICKSCDKSNNDDREMCWSCGQDRLLKKSILNNNLADEMGLIEEQIGNDNSSEEEKESFLFNMGESKINDEYIGKQKLAKYLTMGGVIIILGILFLVPVVALSMAHWEDQQYYYSLNPLFVFMVFICSPAIIVAGTFFLFQWVFIKVLILKERRKEADIELVYKKFDKFDINAAKLSIMFVSLEIILLVIGFITLLNTV
jgi:hypothetical protein